MIIKNELIELRVVSFLGNFFKKISFTFDSVILTTSKRRLKKIFLGYVNFREGW